MEGSRPMIEELELRRAANDESGRIARASYAAFGVSWGMEADDAVLFRLLSDRLPPGSSATNSRSLARSYAFRTLRPAGSDGLPRYLLTADGRQLMGSSEPSEVADAFEDDLKWFVAERSSRRVFLRAGVVGWRDRAIIIPGGPRSGKSTLVRALVGCGATYYSDEYAVLDGNNVQPYPARLPSWTLPGGPLSYLLDEIRGEEPAPPLPVGIVLFAPYQAGAVFKPKLISRGKSLVGMFKYAVASQRQPEQVLRALEMVSRRCNALEGVRGDARIVASYLLDRLV